MLYLVLLMALSSCFNAGYATEDVYDYLRKHPRAAHSYSYIESEDQEIFLEASKFPYKIVGADDQYDILYTKAQTTGSLLSRIITSFYKKMIISRVLAP